MKKDKKREKIFTLTKKDFEIQTFKSGGKGGQHQNKTDSGVRIIHHPSGARGESRSSRSQHVNKKLAFRRLVNDMKFKLWMQRAIFEITSGKTIDERVKEQMNDENLKIQIIDENGNWKERKEKITENMPFTIKTGKNKTMTLNKKD